MIGTLITRILQINTDKNMNGKVTLFENCKYRKA